MSNTTGCVKVSSNFSQAVYQAVRKAYHIESGIYQTTRDIYTTDDIETFEKANNKFRGTKILNYRLHNFAMLSGLRLCNSDDTFWSVLPYYKDVKKHFIILNPAEIAQILYTVQGNDFSVNDLFVNCILLTTTMEKGKIRNFITDFFNV